MLTHALSANSFIIIRMAEPFWCLMGLVIVYNSFHGNSKRNRANRQIEQPLPRLPLSPTCPDEYLKTILNLRIKYTKGEHAMSIQHTIVNRACGSRPTQLR